MILSDQVVADRRVANPPVWEGGGARRTIPLSPKRPFTRVAALTGAFGRKLDAAVSVGLTVTGCKTPSIFVSMEAYMGEPGATMQLDDACHKIQEPRGADGIDRAPI